VILNLDRGPGFPPSTKRPFYAFFNAPAWPVNSSRAPVIRVCEQRPINRDFATCHRKGPSVHFTWVTLSLYQRTLTSITPSYATTCWSFYV